MGGAIAANLRRSGYEVWGFDPSSAAAAKAQAHDIRIVESVNGLPTENALILTSLPSGASLQQTVDALARRASASCVVAELSTLSLQDKELARSTLASVATELLDAPISGTGAQAIEADLSVYVSGAREAWERVSGVFKAFASRPRYVGPFGAGTRLKYIANLLVAIHNVAAAEALTMAEAAGIDLHVAVDVLREGAGNSRILELRGPMMARHTYVPATMKLEVWEKDMALIEAFARDRGVRTPLFDTTQAIYAEARRVRPQEDTAGVFEVLRS